MKGSVSFGRTISVKRYNTLRIEWSREVDLDLTSLEEAAKDLQHRVDAYLEGLGVNVVGP